MPLYREELDTMPCGNPDCDHTASSEGPHEHKMVLMAQCHPTAGMRVWYEQGAVHAACASCGKDVASVYVASQKESNELRIHRVEAQRRARRRMR
jgi:hypothetical protein